MVLEKTLESPLDCMEIKPVSPKGNQPWIYNARTDAEVEVPILWPPDAKNWLIGKTLMLGKTEGKRGRGWQRMIWLDSITDSMDMCLSKLFKRQWKTKEPGLLQSMGLQRIRHDSATEHNNKLTLGYTYLFELKFSLDKCPGVRLLDHIVVTLFLVF